MLQSKLTRSAPTLAREEWADGGRVVLAAASGLGVGVTLFAMTSGLFIVPMQKELGLSRMGASIAPIAGLGAALLAPVAGIIIDRIGSRSVAILGLITLAAAYLMLGFMPTSVVVLYSIVAFLALIGTMSSTVVFSKGVATWFVRNSGLAFALTMTGTSVVAAASFPLLAYAIENYGWRSGYIVLAMMALVVGLPMVLAWFHERKANPDRLVSQAPVEGSTLREALREPRYWICMTAFAAAAVAIGGFLTQMQPMLTGFGLSMGQAALAGSIFAIGVGLGRIVAGYMLDLFRPNRVAALFLSLPIIGVVMLTTQGNGASFPFIAAAAFLLGCGQGAEGDFIAFFTLRLFGLKAFAAIFSTVGLTVSIGMATGGMVFAMIFDRFGNYDLAIMIAGAMFAIAALCILAVRMPRVTGGHGA